MKFQTSTCIQFKITLLILLLFGMIIVSGCIRPKPTAVVYEPIDVYHDPVQEGENKVEPIAINHGPDFYGRLEPQAMYKIAAMVAGKKIYHYDWSAKIAPVDLALIWGNLTDSRNKRYITYSQSNRWYFFRYRHDCPLDSNYISSHSANNHIIPANKNILKIIRSLAVGQKVVLEGYLVNLSGTKKGRPVWWNSSLTRVDSGNGSCELFYVNRIQVGQWVYE